MTVKQIPIKWLKPAEYNPRQATKKQHEDLKESIKKFGLVDPIIVNSAPERENIVIGGHFRLRVAKELGLKDVPVVFVNLPDIEKEKELNLRLNRNTGSWDYDLLANNFDMEFLKNIGFDELDFAGWDSDISGIGESSDERKGYVKVTCSQEDEAELRKFLEEKIKDCSLKGIEVV